MRLLIKYIILLAFFWAGCSGTQQVSDVKVTTEPEELETEDPKDKALEFFINGTIAEAKGDYAGAILEYQDALRYDKSAGIYYVLAKNYLLIDKLAPALQNSREAVKLDPDNSEILELLGDIYSASNMADSAVVIYEQVVEKDSLDIQVLYKLARIYESDRPSQAIDIYNNIISVIGSDWNVLLRMAELYGRLENYQQAALTIEELLRLDPSNKPVKMLLIEYYQHAGMNEEALYQLDDILELTPDDMSAREMKAQILIESGRWNEAVEEYNKVLESTNADLDTRIRIGAGYFAQSIKDSTFTPVVKEYFNKLDSDTTEWEVKMYLGAIAINEGNDSAAIDYFKEVTSLANWNSDAWIRLGGLYFDNQKYEEAIIVMNEAVILFPEDFVINLILGLSYAQTGQHNNAKTYLFNAINANPSDINALSAYAYTLSQLKENEDAIIYLNKALQLQPDDVNLLGTLGMIYDSIENWEKCDSVYERALQIDPQNALVNSNYAYSLSERGIQLERALKMVKISIDADPNNSSYLDTIGWVYYKLGDYENARKYLEQAIAAGGESAVMLDHLGDALYKLGQKDEALKLWKKAYEIDSSDDRIKLKIEKGEI